MAEKTGYSIDGQMLHRSITMSRVLRLVQADDYDGLCIACGESASNVEPDARHYPCPACGRREVYGAEEILMVIG